MNRSAHDTAARGVVAALAAYLVWGFFPLYFKLTASVPALQVLASRIVWSTLFLLPVLALSGRLAQLNHLLRQRSILLRLSLTTLLIATNWGLFIYAVETGRVVESSLGYFINPLVNALLGALFLHERISRLQRAALFLAAAGVALRTFQIGGLPWISLTLALTFALYGLLRKQAGSIDPIAGLTIETGLLTLPALFVLAAAPPFAAHAGVVNTALIMSGLVTAVPLVLFAYAAQRLRLTTVGFLQYITPTLHLLLAVLFFNEPFSTELALPFLLIWSGILLYSADTLHRIRVATAA